MADQKKNYLEGLAEPRPGLVFIFTLFVLNYKFWIIAFGSEAEKKIPLIKQYFAFDLCNIVGKVWKQCFFTSFCAEWEIFYNIFLAIVVALTYPAVINGVKFVYEKFTNKKIPISTTVEELNATIKELEEEKKELEKQKNSNQEKLYSFARQIFKNSPFTNEVFLELCSKIEIYLPHDIWINEMRDKMINLKQVLFILYNSEGLNDETFNNKINYIIKLQLQDKYLILEFDVADLRYLYPPIKVIFNLKKEEFQKAFKDEIKTFANELVMNINSTKSITDLTTRIIAHIDTVNQKVNEQLRVIKREDDIFASLGHFKIIGYFHDIGKLINFQGRLVLAEALYIKQGLLEKLTLTEKEKVVNLLGDLVKENESLEDALERIHDEIFKEENNT